MEKGGEREAEKHEPMLWKGGKRREGGPITPSTIWRYGFKDEDSSVSARKLCASLWETHSQAHHQLPLPLPPPSTVDGMSHHRGHRHRRHQGRGFDDSSLCGTNPSQQQATASGLRRHVEVSLTKNHRVGERSDGALRHVSPRGCSSSMEAVPHDPVVTPTSSSALKGGTLGNCGYSVRTSTELLKVLNRIWSLEEHHASNKSLVKALKLELDLSRAKIKELQQHKTDREEIDDRIKLTVQSMKNELDDERKLRKRSETLHRKLARDLSETKSSLANALKELENERKSRVLLEDLCDEFAKGIRDYEQEVRSMKHKPENDQVGRESSDRLVLHISESWLDERMQMKVAENLNGIAEKNTIVERLSIDIETFLRTKRSNEAKRSTKFSANEIKGIHSLESFHFSAPRNADDEESSSGDSYCFELNKGNESNDPENCIENMMKSYPINKEAGISCFRVEFENPVEVNNPRTNEIYEDSRENLQEQKEEQIGIRGLNSKLVSDGSIKNHSLMSESDKARTEVSESVMKWPLGLKENSLKSKLLEARLRGRHSRTKALF